MLKNSRYQQDGPIKLVLANTSEQSQKHIYEQTPRFKISNEADEYAPISLELNIQGGKIDSGLDDLSEEQSTYIRQWLHRITPGIEWEKADPQNMMHF